MFLPAAANFAWWTANLPSAIRFRISLANPMAVQDALLSGYIRANAGTEFGRRHGFDRIRSIDDFRAAVPIRDYDGLAADIDRVAAGAANVLTAEPVIRLATSSGSTRARKLIPYTRSLQAEINRAVAPWIADLYRSDPSIACGRAYWSITPVGEAAAPP